MSRSVHDHITNGDPEATYVEELDKVVNLRKELRRVTAQARADYSVLEQAFAVATRSYADYENAWLAYRHWFDLDELSQAASPARFDKALLQLDPAHYLDDDE